MVQLKGTPRPANRSGVRVARGGRRPDGDRDRTAPGRGRGLRGGSRQRDRVVREHQERRVAERQDRSPRARGSPSSPGSSAAASPTPTRSPSSPRRAVRDAHRRRALRDGDELGPGSGLAFVGPGSGLAFAQTCRRMEAAGIEPAQGSLDAVEAGRSTPLGQNAEHSADVGSAVAPQALATLIRRQLSSQASTSNHSSPPQRLRARRLTFVFPSHLDVSTSFGSLIHIALAQGGPWRICGARSRARAK